MKKHKLNKQMKVALGTFILVVILFPSCRDENSVLLTTDRDYALRMSFEQERYTVQDMPGVPFKEQTPTLQVAAPIDEKTHIDIKIYEDGTSEWVMTKLTPTNPVDIPQECLPDITPKAVKTVLRHNMAYYFDDEGNLINSGEIDIPSFSEFLDLIRTNGNQVTRELYSRYMNADYLKSSSNDEITKLESGLTKVKHVFTAEDGVPENLIGKTGQRFIETASGLLRGVAIVNQENNFEFRKAFLYNEDESIFIPKYEKSESFNIDTEGNFYTVKTTTFNRNIVIENNL